MLAAQEQQPRGLPHLQGKLRRDGRIGPAADAVGAEIFADHGLSCPAAGFIAHEARNHLRAIWAGKPEKIARKVTALSALSSPGSSGRLSNLEGRLCHRAHH